MNASESPRWTRLADDLRATGLEVAVTSKSYPGGVSHSIEFRAGDVLVCIHDKWAHGAWAGWQVHTEGVADGLVRRTWPLTKKRSEVAAAVSEALPV